MGRPAEAREAALDQVHQVDHRELETLGVVDGQQVHRVLFVLDRGRGRIVAHLDEQVEVPHEVQPRDPACSSGPTRATIEKSRLRFSTRSAASALSSAASRPSSPLSVTNS